MSSRRGRRQRGRARSWDPDAARRARAAQRGRRVMVESEPEDEPEKVNYWMGRYRRLVDRDERRKAGREQDKFGMLIGRSQQGAGANRAQLRSHGVGVRGVVWSRKAKKAKTE